MTYLVIMPVWSGASSSTMWVSSLTSLAVIEEGLWLELRLWWELWLKLW